MKRVSLPLLVLLAACAPDAPPPESPHAFQITASPPANAEPTKLDAAQRARDQELAKKIDPILDAFGNIDPHVSPDGKKLAFRSNRDGVPELFVADPSEPAEAAKKIVPGPERVGAIHWTADGKWIVFTRDEGADENWRIYRVKPDGTDLGVVTPGEKLHRDEPVLPRSKAGVIVFASHDPKSASGAVTVAQVDGSSSKVVYTDPVTGGIIAVTPDATHALYERYGSPTDQVLLDVDLVSGKAKQLYPAEGKAVGIAAADYSADGKRVFVATNEGTETNVLLALDATTYKETARVVQDRPSTASFGEVGVSPKGDRLCVVVDAGNHSEVRVHDARTLKFERDVKLPLGSAGACTFTDDGKHFTVTTTTPDTPTDFGWVDPSTGKFEPLRADKRPGLADLAPLETTLATIPAHDKLVIPLHSYLPKNRDPQKKLPVLVHFHGGPASSSSVGWNWMARAFTAQGFAFVEPNIRGSTGFGRAYEMADNKEKRADALKDVETVNAWVRQQPWADPNRVVIFGGSYGGYLVLMGLTRQPKIWSAGVDLVGISNLVTFMSSTDQAIRAAFVDEFGDLDRDRKLLEEFSPMRDREKIVAPLFVYQGQNDPRVARPESDQMVASLRGRKIPVEYMVAMNEGHSVDRRENKSAFVARVTRFLAEQLK